MESFQIPAYPLIQLLVKSRYSVFCLGLENMRTSLSARAEIKDLWPLSNSTPFSVRFSESPELACLKLIACRSAVYQINEGFPKLICPEAVEYRVESGITQEQHVYKLKIL